MAPAKSSCLVISEFNAANLAGYLNNDESGADINARVAPMAAVMATLLDPQASVWREKPDFTIIWTQPQGVIESFAAVLRNDEIEPENLTADVDRYADAIVDILDRTSQIIIPTWTTPPWRRGLGLGDFGPRGIARALGRMNTRLVERFEYESNVHVVNAAWWFESTRRGAYDAKGWYLGKIPFSSQVFRHAATDIRAFIAALSGEARKLIVVDLDNTLWGGIVGETGWENIRLGGHDAVGEAFADFQSCLSAKKNRGIMLAILSKNDESVALQAIDAHPEMVLRTKDFVGWRINWEDKARNLADLVASLNLGLQSVVFIDDNPAERDRVRSALPEVLVPEWPNDPMKYVEVLESLSCFDAAGLSNEDDHRTEMYASEEQRQELKARVGSVDEWLKQLELKVVVEPLSQVNLKRAAQLLNKTNQMNLATRRMSEGELREWADAPANHMWTFRAKDRLGDSGIVGIVSMSLGDGSATMVDFILSCRVFGRTIEDLMTHTVVCAARKHGAADLVVHYVKTEKNMPCYEYWSSRSGFDSDGDGVFRWRTRDEFAFPDLITVEEGFVS